MAERLGRPGPSVADDQGVDEIGSTPRDAEPDRSAAVLHHESDVGQPERRDELLNDLGVLLGFEAVSGSGGTGPKPG